MAEPLNELLAFGKGIGPVLKVLTDQDEANAVEALAAVVEGAAAEQRTEDAVNASVNPVSTDAYDSGLLELEAAVDHALVVRRALHGRFKASSADSRDRRAIIAILRGE